MTNISDILNKPASEVERPKPLPEGSYTCVVRGLPTQGESTQRRTPFVQFDLQPIEAREDVDEKELNSWMKRADGTSRVLKEATIRGTYYLTEDALWRLTDFLEHCWIDLNEKSIQAAIDETPNSQVIAYLRHRPSQDGQSIFAELAKTAPVEE